MFSLRLSVSARALSWKFLFLFVEVQARDNSEKQEASAMPFPSWSPATRRKNKQKKKPKRGGLCHYFVQLETVRLNVVLLPASGRCSACHWGPKGHHIASAIGSAKPTHCSQGFAPAATITSWGKHPASWHSTFLLSDAAASSSGKIKVFS